MEWQAVKTDAGSSWPHVQELLEVALRTSDSVPFLSVPTPLFSQSPRVDSLQTSPLGADGFGVCQGQLQRTAPFSAS
jgi:hypothetical protein